MKLKILFSIALIILLMGIHSPAYSQSKTVKVLFVQKAASVRSGPGTKYKFIGKVSVNDTVITTGDQEKGWVKVTHSLLKDGGWVPARFLGDNMNLKVFGGTSFRGSGHEAGYNWAEENDIHSADDCDSNSNSFTEGCEDYVEENGSNH